VGSGECIQQSWRNFKVELLITYIVCVFASLMASYFYLWKEIKGDILFSKNKNHYREKVTYADIVAHFLTAFIPLVNFVFFSMNLFRCLDYPVIKG
jgi:hypothetical protein